MSVNKLCRICEVYLMLWIQSPRSRSYRPSFIDVSIHFLLSLVRLSLLWVRGGTTGTLKLQPYTSLDKFHNKSNFALKCII